MSEMDDAIELYAPRMLDALVGGQGDHDISDLKWRQKNYSLIRLGDMDDDHLRNTALMLMGMGYQQYRAPDSVKIKWLTALRMEWERRLHERGGQTSCRNTGPISKKKTQGGGISTRRHVSRRRTRHLD